MIRVHLQEDAAEEIDNFDGREYNEIEKWKAGNERALQKEPFSGKRMES